MIVTEEQAKELWCPMASTVMSAGTETVIASANRRIVFDAVADAEEDAPARACHCLASRCMWWEWVTVGENDEIVRMSGPAGIKRGQCGAKAR